jgi:hypothetical protein
VFICRLVTFFSVGTLIHALTIFGLGLAPGTRFCRSYSVLVPLGLPCVTGSGIVPSGLLPITALGATTPISVALTERAR